MKYFAKYEKCIYCGSKKLKISKDQNIPKNFYLRAIQSDLKIPDSHLKKMKVFECSNCNIIQNNPWFTKEISRKIYSNIYGQHNRGWSNLINFLKKGIAPNHGSLFDLLNKKIKIKRYAEFNSPFMGIFLNFFLLEYKKSKSFYRNIFKNIIAYLTSRQVAGQTIKYQKQSFINSKKFLKKINFLKNKNQKKNKIDKYLFIDNSNLCWGQNDNYKSVNSKSFASELLDLNITDLNIKNKNIRFDLFGIFHTLDHTFEPNKVLKYALDVSKCVIVYCHINPKLEKQHLFSLTKEFLLYLNKQNIFTIDLTNAIKKKDVTHEMYFLCSKNKKYLNKLLKKK
jgi:hypothetical protein